MSNSGCRQMGLKLIQQRQQTVSCQMELSWNSVLQPNRAGPGGEDTFKSAPSTWPTEKTRGVKVKARTKASMRDLSVTETLPVSGASWHTRKRAPDSVLMNN